MPRDPALGPKPSAASFVSDAASLLSDDPRIVLLTLAGGALSIVPVVGPVLNVLVVGFAHLLAHRSLGRSADTRASLPRRFLYLIGGSLATVVLVVIGLILLIVPGIYLLLRLSLVVPAIMIDGEGPLEGLGESWDRTGGNVVTVLGVFLVFWFVGVLAAVPVVLAFGIDRLFVLPVDPTAQLAFNLVTGAVSAFGVAGLVLMYGAFGEDGTRLEDGSQGQRPTDAQW